MPSALDLDDDDELLEDMDRALTPEEREDLEQAEDELPHFSYSGQDFDVAGLVHRQQAGDIVIPQFDMEEADGIELDGFQRKFVWTRPQMDRFIESLLMGLPVPNVFFVRQSDHRYLVLDGQQRLTTLRFFYEGRFRNRPFALKNVSKQFQGVTYRSLEPGARRALDNQFLQAIIVSADGTAESRKTVYKIFERLNSGGTQLTAHEIRMALYAGPAIRFLAKLNAMPSWRQIYGKEPAHARDQELVLRAVAMALRARDYSAPLKSFLNDTCEHMEVGLKSADWTATVEQRFGAACDALLRSASPRAGVLVGAGKVVNAAKGEAVLAALMVRPDAGAIDGAVIDQWLAGLDDDQGFRASVSQATAEARAVQTRLHAAWSSLDQLLG